MGAVAPIEKICTYQKQIVKQCINYAKPVYIAGHVLGSLHQMPYPLRADAFDVYNAVIDGVDGFILSSEILNEENWRATLQIFQEIVTKAEGDLQPKQQFQQI